MTYRLLLYSLLNSVLSRTCEFREFSPKISIFQTQQEYCGTCYACLKQKKCGGLTNHCKALYRLDFTRIKSDVICSYRTIHTVKLLHRNKSKVRAEFCCTRAMAGRSGGLGLTKTGKCLTDDNFFDEIQFLCPYRSIFNRKVFIFIFARFLSKYFIGGPIMSAISDILGSKYDCNLCFETVQI